MKTSVDIHFMEVYSSEQTIFSILVWGKSWFPLKYVYNIDNWIVKHQKPT